MKRAKLYYAWCLAKADGTTHQQNVDWMTETEAKTQKSRRLALTKKVVKLLRDAGFGPHAAPEAPADPSAGPARGTRSRAAPTGATGPVTLTREQWMAIPEPVAGSYNEAAMMAACEKVEVAEGGRVNGFPVCCQKKEWSSAGEKWIPLSGQLRL